ncbi:MAG: hypothetical protein QOF65_2957 [Thermoleophilaceae bacterium]|nr:hypothetical protein [Thermoleophilaceae bacterium]
MRRRVPSPAMVVALVALAVSLSGTAVAAVDFARNAGAVDGHSAVSSDASLSAAKGKLVATANEGSARGRIPGRFLTDVMRGGATPITRYLRSIDNQPGPVVAIASIAGIGTFNAQCRDQDPDSGVKSTQTLITFTASEAKGVNVSRLLGRDIDLGRDGVVFTALPSQPVPIISFADTMFRVILQAGDRTVFVSGSARSDANHSSTAACLIWGIGLRVG